MDAVTARWSSWSFLVYAGGIGLGLAGAGWLAYLDAKTGAGADVLWALLVFAVLAAVAERCVATGHRVTAGVVAFTAIGAFVEAFAQLFAWFGWTTSMDLQGFHPGRLLVALVWIAAAIVALRRYRFPLITAQLVYATVFFVADLVSGGGTWTALVMIALGLVTLAVAAMLDTMGQQPWAFWPHVGSGLMIGGGALYCVRNGGVFAWALIVLASIAYVAIARSLGRSSWAVLGALGVLIAAGWYTAHWSRFQLLFFGLGDHDRPWVPPLVGTAAAALLIALGFWASRERT